MKKHLSKNGWVEKFARFGFVSKGVVYCLIGVLAALAAFGSSNEKTSKTGAFKLVYDQPFGKFLLILIALGLLGYVAWRFFQAFSDTEHKGKDAEGVFTRIGYAGSGLLYLSLCIYAMKLAITGPGGGDGNSRQFIVSKALALPAGTWLVGIAALIIIGRGIFQIYKGVSGKYLKKVQLINSSYYTTFKNSGIVGYIAHGIVLGIIGYFLLRAAIESNASQAQGTDKAFDFLQDTFGAIMMAIVAFGVMAYGIFMFVRAKYQRINLPHF